MATAAPAKGLEGIVAASSGICWIDGEAGVLSYRGLTSTNLPASRTSSRPLIFSGTGNCRTLPSLQSSANILRRRASCIRR